jgi:hypothetical protein
MTLNGVSLKYMWRVCGLLLGLGMLAGKAGAAERAPIGPFQIELSDKSSVSGVLLEVNDETIVLRTAEGDRSFERKRVKNMEPLAGKAADIALAQAGQGKRAEAERAPARPPHSEDQKPAKPAAPKEALVDDLPEALAPAPKNAGDAANEGLLIRKLRPNNTDAADKNDVIGPRRLLPNNPAPDANDLDRAISFINAGAFKQASASLRNVLKTSDETVRAADSIIRQKYNKPLSDVLVMCYTLIPCGPCKGDGVVKCELCGGTGYLNKNVGTPISGAVNAVKKVLAEGGQSRPRISLCDTCRGNGFDVCATCLGTRQAFAEPTLYEREAYAAYMLRMGTETLITSESNYGDTGRESMPTIMPDGDKNLRGVVEQVWLRDTSDRVKSDITRLWRAEGFFRMALKGDPTLSFRSPKDLNQELNKIGIRRRMLYGELSERLRFQNFNIHE